MLDDISINSLSAINVAYIFVFLLHNANIYFLKDFLIDAQLADFLHYDVTKLN